MSIPAPAVVAVLGKGLVPPDQPLLLADDLGLTRGDGCFDATRVRMLAGKPVVDHLDRHLDRFSGGAQRLGLKVDRPAWQALVDQAVAAWDGTGAQGEATVKLILTGGSESGDDGPTGLVQILPVASSTIEARAGVKVVTLASGTSSRAYTDAPWLLGGVKTISYALNRAATREARRRGADDAIWVSLEGHLLEAPTSTLMVRRGEALLTPDPEPAGLLDSITAQVILEAAPSLGMLAAHQDLTATDVTGADGAWLVSSVRGVVPILTLDDVVVPQDPATTDRLRRAAGF